MPTDARSRLQSLLLPLAGWPRRLTALLCLLGAAVSALSGAHPRPVGRSGPVLVAARRLTAGTVLAAADIRSARWDRSAIPDATLTVPSQVLGHRIGSAMSRGEPLTSTRLLDLGVTGELDVGQVASTLSLSNAGQASILQAGSTVDLYAAASSMLVEGSPTAAASAAGRALATGVRVLAVLSATTTDEQPSVIVASDRTVAAALAAHSADAFVATLVRPP